MKTGVAANLSEWSRPPADLRLAEMAVHVWRAFLDVSPAVQRRLEETVSADERAAARRLRLPDHRRRLLASRGIVRLVLGRYLAADPRALRFVRRCGVCGGPHGKPTLAAPYSGLSFSVAHSHGVGLVAVARGRRVGVDCELVRSDVAFLDIAERFFTPAETAALSDVPEAARPEAFFDCWVRKEAYVKGVGLGLSLSLSSFDVWPADPAGRRVPATGDPWRDRAWHLVDLSPAPGYAGALAIEGDGWTVEGWHAVA